jgi:hypothetical protein
MRQREQEKQQRFDGVVAEFGGDRHAMVAEILRYRRSLAQIAQAIDWTKLGAQFAMILPARMGGQNDRHSSQ